MKLFAPEYYKDFVCIADRCRHSCCVGWEIDIDGATAEKYASLGGAYALEIRKSIDNGGDVPHFKLAERERCPHLNCEGLCRIIIEYGEGLLCDICREHPRFYNYTVRGAEAGLGMACEEACHIILTSDNYKNIVAIGELDGEAEGDFDVLSHRERIYSVLSDDSLEYTERLRRICEKYSLSPALLSDGECRALLDSLEYLDETHRELFCCYSSNTETLKEHEKMLERALAYFIYRHLSPADDENELREALAFCLFCERLIASLLRSGKGDASELARIVSEELEYSEENTERIKFEYSFVIE